MQDVPLHQIGIIISLGQREEERAAFKLEVARMRSEGKINAAGEYYILNTPDPKDAMLLAAMFEKKYDKRQDMIRQQNNEAQQKIVEQQGQNVMANTQQQTQGKAALIQEQAKAEAQLMQLGAQLGLNAAQVDGMIKRAIQNDRLQGATDKSLKTVYAKQNAEQQQPLV